MPGLDGGSTYGAGVWRRLRPLARLAARPITPAPISRAGREDGQVLAADRAAGAERPDAGEAEEEQAEDEVGDLQPVVGGGGS